MGVVVAVVTIVVLVVVVVIDLTATMKGVTTQEEGDPTHGIDLIG